jgi:hypothetical protein
VYLNKAVLLSINETKFAYLIAAPTMSVKRGVPVTVIDSENAIVKVGVSTGLYVALAGGVTVEIIGAVRSITIVVLAAVAEDGPDALPVTELAFNLGVNVPSPHEETDKAYVFPEPETENEQLNAVPAFSKSVLSIPVTDSDIVSE